MTTIEKNEVEQLKQQEEIQKELKKTGGRPEQEKPAVETKHKVWLGTYVLVLIALGVLLWLFGLEFFGLSEATRAVGQRLTRGAIMIVLLLTVGKIIEAYLIGRVDDAASRFNLKRILRLVVGLVLIFIIISVLFANWYTAVLSLGLISLILGFALQTPITSFIGWIYILVREPYRVGDRIRVGEATGDVIDVSYLDTTLWEFGGPYLSTDHPSGRIIKFPNSNILDTPVFNYSWPLFPYIWNEIVFHIAYESDLEFVSKTMLEIAEEELGEAMMKRVNTYRELLAQTPVDQLEVRERPAVFFRVSQNTWIEAIVRYLVYPREAGRVKTRMIQKMLERLNSKPDLVMFPKSNMR
jgi:small-conductance mechanosensitive channel